MNMYYIGLGSNIAPRYQYLKQAIEALRQEEKLEVSATSPIYETVPVGFKDQANFLNMVLEIESSLSPLEMLHVTQSVEEKLGRKREKRWGPRTIDLDILLYNHENMITEQLIIPHPRMQERAFVLIPLHDINPEVYIPSLQINVATALNHLPLDEKRGVVKWNPST